MMITNANITIYNHKYNKQTRLDKWNRTVIRGVHFHVDHKSSVGETGLSSADIYKIRIPEDAEYEGEYVSEDQYQAMENTESSWTLQTDDYVVLGEYKLDIEKPSDLKASHIRHCKMETSMRAQREKIHLLQVGGADPDDVMLAKAKYQGQLNEYSRFSKKMGIREERERIYIDNLGRVASGKSIAKDTDSAIIKSKKMYRRKNTNLIEPMPKRQLQKIVKGLKKSGGVIQMSDATDAYLESKKAETITYNEKTILLKQKSGRAAVFEELIHATQFRKKKTMGHLRVGFYAK